MRGVRIDPKARRARVRAGASGRTSPGPPRPTASRPLAGTAHDVGVVGYTLGGGLGWLAREHGFACNSVTAIELVTADGRLVRTDARTDPELFWALRGGGGNFGVVTAIEFELYPVERAHGGALLWPAGARRGDLHRLARLDARPCRTRSRRCAGSNVPPLPGPGAAARPHSWSSRPRSSATTRCSPRCARSQPELDLVGPMPPAA